jgi:uncharacterized protein YceH (UPF0502 family)
MALLGILALALAAAAATSLVVNNTGPVEAEVFGRTLDGLSVGELFLLGMGAGALALGGLVLLLGSAGRGTARRRAARSEVKEIRHERETLAEQNARLQGELEERERQDRERLDAATYPSESDTATTAFGDRDRRSDAVRDDVDVSSSGRGRHRLLGR